MGRQASSGHVEKRINSIRLRFNYEGARVYETVRLNGAALPPTAANLKYAQRLAKTVLTEIGSGTFDYAEHFPESPRAKLKVAPAQQTFGVLAALWLQSKGTMAAATRDQYGSAVRFWNRLLGADTPLAALDHKLIAAKIGGHPWPSAKTHNNYLIALRGIFALEYRGAKAADNPVEGVENMSVVRRLPDPLGGAERDRILADIRQRYDERVYAYYLWMFYTGMRPEEAIALRWSDIDESTGTARVQRVRTFKGSERDGTKTHAERDVDLVAQAIEALRLMKPHTFMQRVERKGDEDGAADIFQNPVTGKAWHDERSQRDNYWKPSLKRLGIRSRRAYSTRHTYCTVALMAGVPPAYIAQQAGHSVQMLLEKYARWIPGADGGAAKRMLAVAMGSDLAPEWPRPSGDAAKSLISKGKVGRRDWTRTKKSGSTGA